MPRANLETTDLHTLRLSQARRAKYTSYPVKASPYLGGTLTWRCLLLPHLQRNRMPKYERPRLPSPWYYLLSGLVEYNSTKTVDPSKTQAKVFFQQFKLTTVPEALSHHRLHLQITLDLPTQHTTHQAKNAAFESWPFASP